MGIEATLFGFAIYKKKKLLKAPNQLGLCSSQVV